MKVKISANELIKEQKQSQRLCVKFLGSRKFTI